ncbi:OmpP1/FadL family transporter [Roseobacter sp. S98]|uniref:OmpP1/FadL family transporter n=1 Tax=Roseobacter algicola (ex Choi et al. 2025) (nom. illeg.) TaxID=3092138 RepID=UPI003F513D8D
MRVYIGSVTALCLAAGGAQAGAIDRSGQSVDVLFEDGRYLEFSFGAVAPDLTGESVSALPNGSGSGNISPDYFTYGAAYKADINDRWSYALILDEPFGAEVDYADGTGYFAQGSDAEFESRALTGLLQYNMNNGMSVYGGLRIQSAEANANVIFGPLGLDYSAEADVHYGVGYVAGIAYEKPEIALRVSLTWNSEISHSVDTVETQAGLPAPVTTSTEFETPQSVNLAFQTGVAANTLLFGGVRWVDWSDFALDPALYQTLTGGPLLSYEEDVITYTLGIGRKLNENWSVAASVGYEENTGNLFTNLGPNDGQESIGFAVIYTKEKMKITTGLRYVRVGDTQTRAGPFSPAAAFDDNDAIAFGVKVGFNF